MSTARGPVPTVGDALRRDLRYCTADGMTHSAMVGFGETFAPAFALALGHSEVTAGLLSTAPLFAGAALQLVTPAGVRWLASHRRWLVGCALAQVASLLVLLGGALADALPLPLLFGSSVLYWAAAFSAGSAWNSWMVGLVPRRLRATFFARRTRFAQIVLCASFLAGGALLHQSSARGMAWAGFALLFGLAALSRLGSAACLARQTDTPPEAIPLGAAGGSEVARNFARGATGPLFLYLLAVQLAVQVAAPFFTPYMLEELDFPYGAFVSITGTALLSRVLVLPWLGHLAYRRGARFVLGLGGVGIVPLSLLWVFSDRFEYLLAIQVLAGAAWAAYELAVLLLFFESLRGPERLHLLALFNVTSTAAMLAGSLLGGSLFAAGMGYAGLFTLSFGARLLSLLLLRRLPADNPHREAIPVRNVAIRPSMGAVQPPVVAAIDHTDPAPAPGEALSSSR